MAYVKTDWQTGDIITADLLNHMEQGIADYQVGPKGDPGPAGNAGADGEAATVTVGTVTTGAAGSQASVTNAGTTAAAILNFAIPQGEKGDTGAAGAKGETGDTGAKGDTGLGVKAIALTTDASGAVTGGTVTFTDNTTAAITVTTAGA